MGYVSNWTKLEWIQPVLEGRSASAPRKNGARLQKAP